MLTIAIGVFLIILSLLPGGKFYPGRLGTNQVLPPIEPAWIGRLVILMFGLTAIFDGVWELRRGSH